jgi:hypothetical protein
MNKDGFDGKINSMTKEEEIDYLLAENARLRLLLSNALTYAKIVAEESIEKGRRAEDRK